MHKIPTFLINLERDYLRKANTLDQLDKGVFDITLIKAVDGKELKQEFINENCDLEAIEANPKWLSPGAIGCALSHLDVYQKIRDLQIPYALILEDDKSFPQDFGDLCRMVIPKMEQNEVTLLYYESPEHCEFSLRTQTKLEKGYSLLHPVKKHTPITTGAYLITLEAATQLAKGVTPIKVAADTWHHFISRGLIKNFRCLYPLVIHDANFKSSIGYVDVESWRYRLTRFIDQKRIPLLYNMLKYRRKALRSKRIEFDLVDKAPYKEGLEIISE